MGYFQGKKLKNWQDESWGLIAFLGSRFRGNFLQVFLLQDWFEIMIEIKQSVLSETTSIYLHRDRITLTGF